MAAVYDATVRTQLYNYENALRRYPISPQRRRLKVKKLRQFLQSLSKNPMAYPMCESKTLGQSYNNRGDALFPYLRETNYEDESKTQWRVSFFQVSANMVKIYRLIQSTNVDESYRKTIRLTEAQFKRMLTECITKIINEIA